MRTLILCMCALLLFGCGQSGTSSAPMSPSAESFPPATASIATVDMNGSYPEPMPLPQSYPAPSEPVVVPAEPQKPQGPQDFPYPAPGMPDDGSEVMSVAVDLGQTLLLEDVPLSITFVEIVEDSRCPEGVVCVWEGEVIILLQVQKGEEQQEVLLTTLHNGTRSDATKGAWVFDRYLIELARLDSQGDQHTAVLALWERPDR
jgi:hypothetical protein